MNLSLSDLNDLYYCVGKVKSIDDVKMIENERCEELLEKLIELINKMYTNVKQQKHQCIR